jgi:hypothetical protein
MRIANLVSVTSERNHGVSLRPDEPDTPPERADERPRRGGREEPGRFTGVPRPRRRQPAVACDRGEFLAQVADGDVRPLAAPARQAHQALEHGRRHPVGHRRSSNDSIPRDSSRTAARAARSRQAQRPIP